MTQFKKVIFISIMLLMSGCLSLPEIVQRSKIKNMIGKPIEFAFAELGPGADVYPIPSGTVYEWNSYRENVRNELVEAYAAPGPGGLTQYQVYDDVTYRYKCVIKIFVDKSTKLIADHTVEGNDCKAW